MERVRSLILAFHKNRETKLLEQMLPLLKTEPEMYSVTVRITNHFYMGMEHGKAAAFIYTSAEYAEEFAKGLKWSGMEAERAGICPEMRQLFFEDLYRSGFEIVVLDKSHEAVLLPLSVLLEEQEGRRTEADIMNPDLMRVSSQYYQSYVRRGDIGLLQDQMCEELYKARYLLPGADRRTMLPPLVTDSKGGRFCPVFTDRMEFDRFDTKRRFGRTVARFRELKRAIGPADGVVINPFGFGLKLDMEKLLRIEREQNKLRIVK